MPEVSKPRAGSLAFYPRKRAKRIYPVVKTYPQLDRVLPLLFAGYKAGMGRAVIVDNVKGSPTFNKEIVVPVTILDCPPLKVLGIRFYKKTVKGLRVLTEVWIKDLPKDLKRKIKNLKITNHEKKLEELEKKLNEIEKIRLIVCTQPRLSGLKKKKPEVFEVEIGGKDVKQKFEYAKKVLGKEIRVSEIFREGEYVDVIGVTKGKGTAGPVKRFGVKIQRRKATQKRRHVGTLGAEGLGKVLWTVPQAGQLGYQRRTELNKRILKIGKDGREITPKGGFIRYGVISSEYLVLEGSVPGPKKRLIMVRAAIRPPKVRIMPVEVREIII